MFLESLLAWLHFLAIFLLVTALATQAVLLRPDLTPDTVRRLARYDRLYLVAAVAVLVTGVLRLVLGAKGADFLMPNPWFHAKIGLFVVIGLISIIPTTALLRWTRHARADAAYVPDAAQIKRARRYVMIEAHLLILLPLFAAMMARGVGL